MSKWTESAKTHLQRSRVINGRDKLSVDEVINKYPEGVAIDEFEILTSGSDGKEYVVLHIKDTNNYFNGGSLALKVVKGWAEDFDGDVDTASEELKKDGGCVFKIYKTTTKKGNPITAFDPID